MLPETAVHYQYWRLDSFLPLHSPCSPLAFPVVNLFPSNTAKGSGVRCIPPIAGVQDFDAFTAEKTKRV